MCLIDDRGEITGLYILLIIPEEKYLEMHSKDVYWTGDKVIMAPDRFKIFIALENGNLLTAYWHIPHAVSKWERDNGDILEELEEQ